MREFEQVHLRTKVNYCQERIGNKGEK